jgi:hypothetical protein
MNRFTIPDTHSWYTNPTTNTRQRGSYIKKVIDAFYHSDYQAGNSERREEIGTVENIITTLKNSFRDKSVRVLLQAKSNLTDILKNDLPQILQKTGKTNLTICVIPRAKAESSYFQDQLFFKQTVKNTIDTLKSFSDGTNYIIRHTDTRTTHLVYIMMNVVTPFRGKLYTPLAAMCGSECYYSQAKYN